MGLNIDDEEVTGAELARRLGIDRAAVSQAKWPVRGKGGYYLVPSLLAYIRMLRERRGIADTPAKNLDEELTRWRIQTEKRKDADWRAEKLEEMCDALLVILRDDCARVREAIAAREDAAEIVALLEQVEADVAGIESRDVVSENEE